MLCGGVCRTWAGFWKQILTMCVLRLQMKPSEWGGVLSGSTVSTATSCARLCVKNTGRKPAAPPCSRGKDISICAVLSSQSLCHSWSVALQIHFWRLPVRAARSLRRTTSIADGRARAAQLLLESQDIPVDLLFRLDAQAVSVACKNGFQPEAQSRVPAGSSDLSAVLQALILSGRNPPSRV